MSDDISPARVTTSLGVLRGLATDDGGAEFRGVRYSAPPTGERRFCAPGPLAPWDDEQDATEFGIASVQATGGPMAHVFGAGDLPVGEDCLTLNVWTPGLDDERRPVMVWIHGGAFRMGTGSSPMYDGTRISRTGDLVVVGINYRLGLLGFSASDAPGDANCGLLDQIAALKWVQREIAAFGGDPDHITVFGESAGAKSVECLLAMPAARGLFHRAILQSTYTTTLDPQVSARRVASIASQLGASDTDVAALRSAELHALSKAEGEVLLAEGAGAAGSGGSGPVLDPDSLPRPPIDAIADGATAEIPLLVGTTLDEFHLFALMGMNPAGADPDEAALRAHVAMLLGVDGDDARTTAAIDAYRGARAGQGRRAENGDVAIDAMTDRVFRQHSVRLASAASRHGEVYSYLFTRPSPALEGALGACHGIEIPYVFGNLAASAAFAGDDADARTLSDAVQAAWIAFARGGAPDTEQLGPWPRYDEHRRSTMVLGDESTVVDAPLDAIRDVWDATPF
jgi:para-nitrobenzyl esterase